MSITVVAQNRKKIFDGIHYIFRRYAFFLFHFIAAEPINSIHRLSSFHLFSLSVAFLVHMSTNAKIKTKFHNFLMYLESECTVQCVHSDQYIFFKLCELFLINIDFFRSQL